MTFHLFLTSAQLVDTSVTQVMMNRIETLVEETQQDVLQAHHKLCQSAKDKVCGKETVVVDVRLKQNSTPRFDVTSFLICWAYIHVVKKM